MRWRCGDPDSGVLCKPKIWRRHTKRPAILWAGGRASPPLFAWRVPGHRCGSCRIHLPSIRPQIAFRPWWNLDHSSFHGLVDFPSPSISTISQTGCSISRLVPSLSAHRDAFDSSATPHFDQAPHDRAAQDAVTGRWSSSNDSASTYAPLFLPARLPDGSSARPGKEFLQTVRASDSRA